MGYSLDPISDNCYPGTAVLINKFDIRDEAKLNEVETVLVSARSAEWMEHPKQTVSTLPITRLSTIFYSLTCTIGRVKSARWISARRAPGSVPQKTSSVRRN